jgi:hypothetical protein
VADAVPEDGLPLFMVGHSYGGHAFGLLPNHQRVARFVTFATGAGWHGWMPFAERLRVLAMWRVLGPLLTSWKGYLPWSLLGMGEDLDRLEEFRPEGLASRILGMGDVVGLIQDFERVADGDREADAMRMLQKFLKCKSTWLLPTRMEKKTVAMRKTKCLKWTTTKTWKI